MIYCLLALFRIREIGGLTHKDLIERFEKEYVQKGIFSNELLRVIRHAHELTHECDCEHMPMPTDADIGSIMSVAQEFIVQLERELVERNA